MKRRSVLTAAGLAVLSRSGRAQSYPDRPIRIVVPYAAGGATDTGARALGERLEKILGQPIVVENKAGGGTIIGTDTVAKARPDGYTLLLATGALAVNAAFDMPLPYDTYKDLTPVAHFFDVPILVAASTEAPFKSMAELVARVNALTRRTQHLATMAQTRLVVGDLELDLLSRTVTRDGKAIDVQPQEFKLLEFLMQNSGKIVTRSMILEHVWGLDFDPGTTVLESHMSRLRAKVDRGFDSELIHTMRGYGYVIRPG